MTNKKFGVREVCNVQFTRLSGKGPDSFNIDTAKMTTLEGASTTVYAQGGWGNSRLMAWEGEKTLTFTLEDALITTDAFWALTGSTKTIDGAGRAVYTVKTTSFAGIYAIVATTLFRDDDGNDHAATISIPKAKLQSNLSLSMAPTGDPSSFTYTFDALAGNDDVLFTLTIDDDNYDASTTTTTVLLNNVVYTTKSETPSLAVSSDGAITLTSSSPTISATVTVGATQNLTNLTAMLGRGESVDLKPGSVSNWHII